MLMMLMMMMMMMMIHPPFLWAPLNLSCTFASEDLKLGSLSHFGDKGFLPPAETFILGGANFYSGSLGASTIAWTSSSSCYISSQNHGSVTSMGPSNRIVTFQAACHFPLNHDYGRKFSIFMGFLQIRSTESWLCQVLGFSSCLEAISSKGSLGGGGFYILFYVYPYLGKWSKLKSIFFKWVETTH